MNTKYVWLSRWIYLLAARFLFAIDERYVAIAGPGRLPVVSSPYGRLSTAICNDNHFTPLLRQAGSNDVDILLSPYHDKHPFESEDAVVATYRAIENGYSLVRLAGKGFSTMADYQGRTLATRSYFSNDTGVMLSTIPTKGVVTVYSRVGDMFLYLCVAGLIVLAVWAFVQRRLMGVVEKQQPAAGRHNAWYS